MDMGSDFYICDFLIMFNSSVFCWLSVLPFISEKQKLYQTLFLIMHYLIQSCLIGEVSLGICL